MSSTVSPLRIVPRGLAEDAPTPDQKRVRAQVLKALYVSLDERSTRQREVVLRRAPVSALSSRGRASFLKSVAEVAEDQGVQVVFYPGQRGAGHKAQFICKHPKHGVFVLIQHDR